MENQSRAKGIGELMVEKLGRRERGSQFQINKGVRVGP